MFRVTKVYILGNCCTNKWSAGSGEEEERELEEVAEMEIAKGNGSMNGTKIEKAVHLNNSWKLPVRLEVKRLKCLEFQKFIDLEVVKL
jgi:hypothetical protein